ncbi:hypothetical protein AAFC00_003822 [Neodothiora populina]|uniref:N-acetyltransferase domain-containing protein n=1 Tax=Neodothiora populina TaxID=2781224 RepID=A0ABR3PFI4_9PEZI
MLLNEHTALVTPKVLLVPYCEHHVPRYHEWMQDEVLQELTASEPLTMEEEYSMQRSWRQDADKLTFIVCLAPPPRNPVSSIKAQIDDTSDRMVGDINLFLNPADDDDDGEDDYEGEANDAEADAALRAAALEDAGSAPVQQPRTKDVVGEIELMIAERSLHRQGYGRAALLTFLTYITQSLGDILREYGRSDQNDGAMSVSSLCRLKYLRVKIGESNVSSLRLFESAGFVATNGGPNYFGEIEMRMCLEEGSTMERLREYKGWEDVVLAKYQ